MRYCTHCGAEISEEAVICPKCGCWTSNATTNSLKKGKTNVCASVGFILALVSVVTFFVDFMGLLALAGMIVSIVGLTQFAKNSEQSGKGLAITGISVGACMFLFGIIFWLAVMLP